MFATVLTWEEYEELQWVWKQQRRPAGFVPEPTGHRPLGRPLGLHCSVEARTQRERECVREGVKQRYSQGTTSHRLDGGITWLSPEREPLSLLQGPGIEIWNKVIPKVFLFNLKSAQPNSAPQQSRSQWKANALQAPVSTGVVSTDDHRIGEKMPLGQTKKDTVSKLRQWF